MTRTFIIAEAGVNHNGSVETAKKMIDVAADCRVDAVKFQTFKTELLVSEDSPKADYQLLSTGTNESQFAMLKKLELSKDCHNDLLRYCLLKGIKFLSTPFDIESIRFLDELNLDIFKIPSGEITNMPYLREIGSLKKKVIISTGMATLDEVGDALRVLTDSGTKLSDITVLHANTEYPTPIEDVNLNAMITIGKKFNVKIGYSDHTLGIEVPIAAVALGATVIEKHFTLDKHMDGPDHKASLDPVELKKMVNSIRNIENALGSGEKLPSASESRNIKIVRKSIFATKDIKIGEPFSAEIITTKRPGRGLTPMLWDKLIGKKSRYSYSAGDMIKTGELL